jgi:hypothetical protein
MTVGLDIGMMVVSRKIGFADLAKITVLIALTILFAFRA